MREYDSYLNDDDEQRDIQRFLTMIDQVHKPDGKNTFDWTRSIEDYIQGLLRHCSAGAESKEGSSRDNLPEAPDQLLPLIGKIAAEIAYNTINDIGLHNTIIAVLNTLQQYSWATKVTLIVASYILTYGDNGLNLCCESKLMVDHPSLHFLWDSYEVCSTFNVIEFFPVSAIVESNTDPSMVEIEKQMIVAAYSVIRVIVFAASSQLITRSSREDKLGSFSTTWCSNKLKLIHQQLLPIRDQMEKHYVEARVVEHEDDHHLNISVLLSTNVTAEDIHVYVEGDGLVVNTYSFRIGHYKFAVGKKKYEKEHIKAVFDQKKSVLHVTVPKVIDPDFLQINVVTPS